jgi:hypothetical protein
MGVVGGLRPVWSATVGGADLFRDRDYVSGSRQGAVVQFFARPPGSAQPPADAQKTMPRIVETNVRGKGSRPAKCGMPLSSKSTVQSSKKGSTVDRCGWTDQLEVWKLGLATISGRRCRCPEEITLQVEAGATPTSAPDFVEGLSNLSVAP